MKTLSLMLIAIAAFGLVGKGQTWQQGFVQLKGIDTPNAIVDAIVGRLVFIGDDKDKLDTSKVIMLIGIRPTNEVKMILGYMVTLYEPDNCLMPPCFPKTTTSYLDEKKNNLPKNIIVWLTQKIK